MKKSVADLTTDQVLELTITVPYEEREDDEFKHPTTYYILNASMDGVYFKTRDRIKAQELADKIYGKGKYTVRKAIKAQVR